MRQAKSAFQYWKWVPFIIATCCVPPACSSPTESGSGGSAKGGNTTPSSAGGTAAGGATGGAGTIAAGGGAGGGVASSGGTSGLSIGHVSPEAAEGGTIGLVQEGDRIRIDIPHRVIDVLVDDAALESRRAAMLSRGVNAWKPKRDRQVSTALQAYALMTTSAARGAVRDISQLKPKA